MAKAIKKQALGRGLSALLKENSSVINTANDKGADKLVGSILEIELKDIETNPFQPRTKFGQEELQELSDSIKQLGVIQPITVRKLEGNNFQLVSGERRYRASKMAGLTAIPTYIRLANDQEMLEMALVENIQRKNLDPIEIAMSYQRLIDEINLTQEQMSIRVGKKRSTVTNYLRLLRLDPIIQTGMRDEFISMGHGRALINIEDLDVQMAIYQKILSEKLSVRQTEELVKGYKEHGFLEKPKELKTKDLTPEYVNEGINKFGEFFGSNISVNVNSKGKGKISIAFNSEQDFERIKKLLNKSE